MLYLHQERRMSGIEQVCGIVKWCADTARFAAELPRLVQRVGGESNAWYSNVEVVVATNNVSFTRAQCAQPTVLIEQMSDEIVELATTFPFRAFDRRAGRAEVAAAKGRWHIVPEAFDRAILTKWFLVGFTRYEMLWVIDNDIDLFEVGRTSRLGMDAYLVGAARAWVQELPRFRESSARLLSSADKETPLNTGVMWLKPSRALYDEGIALLRTYRFSIHTGFNNSGRPRDLMPPALAADPGVSGSRMMELNTWNFVAASSDQGLFTLVFLMRHNQLMIASRKDYVIHHFWASSKPWVRNPSCLPYYHALGILAAPGNERGEGDPPDLVKPPPGSELGICLRVLRKKAAEARVGLRKRWRCRGARFQVF
jgi:hypothetical protein